MIQMLRSAVVICVLAMPVQAGAWTILIPYEDKESITAGQQIYLENCAACHGDDLQGEPDWRARDEDGYLPTPPHDATGHT